MESLKLVKIGGNVIDNTEAFAQFLDVFAQEKGHKILVHGGGKIASKLCKDLGIPVQMVEGRRITDQATLEVITMVYAGLVNKKIVAQMQAKQLNAAGLTGADANLITAKKRQHPNIDFGYVGDVVCCQTAILEKLLDSGIIPVIAPLTHNKKGSLFNTNADTVATELAIALTARYKVELVYAFEREGILQDINCDKSIIKKLTPKEIQRLKQTGIIAEGMLPKTENAIRALQNGVSKVIIGHYRSLTGTVIQQD